MPLHSSNYKTERANQSTEYTFIKGDPLCRMQTTTTTTMQETAKSPNVIIIGLPGCGKGTQSSMISEKYGLTHVSTGKLLREEGEKDTRLGTRIREHISGGELLPDELVNAVLLENLPNSGYILDGYPRKLSQTSMFENNISLVLYMTLREAEAIKRILGRRDGREDDNEEAVRIRLEAFRKETKPVIDFYKEKGLLYEIDASGTPEEVFKRVEEAFDKKIPK